MSNSSGAVRFGDGLIMHCEYHGTVDVMRSPLYDTYDEMKENWRSLKWTYCLCKQDEPVTIASSYGHGFTWEGRACRHCKAITDHHSPDYDTEIKGLPPWYPRLDLYIGWEKQ